MPNGFPGGLGPRGHLTEDEKANMPKVTPALLRRIGSYLKPYWPQLLLVFVAILLSAAIGLAPSVITGKIVDQALINRDLAQLIRLCLAALGAVAVSQIIGVAENYINSWISQRIIFDMKNEMYRHLQSMPHAFFTSE
ncbi:MAG: ABC transporter ATP-binding protein, partial [Oscillospiraceae bacterium]|nr:ABC transporter ATP-binding protein [Oscillospiraceae bacterium]